jgi:dynein assembly factor 5
MSAISLPIPPQNLSREINILNEPSSDRSSKKSALEKILKQLTQTQASTTGLENETAAADFKNLCMLILKSLIKTLVDPIEKCREISIKILEM